MRKRISAFVTCSKSPKRVLNGSSMVPQCSLSKVCYKIQYY